MGARARRWAGAMGIGMMMALGAADAGAQPDRYEFSRDSAAPADTARIEAERVSGMEECPVGNVVVADSASLAALRAYPRCRAVERLDGRTLVGVDVRGDCHAVYRIDAFRSEASRELRVRVLNRSGVCRAAGFAYEWLLLPPLPAGWTVRLVERRPIDDAELPGIWTPVRGSWR
ncbi:MAG TPA: hypothetical protein VFR81_01890 [Longimicrobium sp.]|nr:hypothetical protein [Longimicrobium sp.]